MTKFTTHFIFELVKMHVLHYRSKRKLYRSTYFTQMIFTLARSFTNYRLWTKELLLNVRQIGARSIDWTNPGSLRSQDSMSFGMKRLLGLNFKRGWVRGEQTTTNSDIY